METQNENNYVMWIVAAVVVSLIVGSFLDPYLPSAVSNAKKGYQSGFAAAKKLVEESSLGKNLRTPDDIRFVGGTVTAVSGNRLTVHTTSANPFDDPALSNRTVIVAPGTKITTFLAKDSSATPTPIDLSAITVGSSIMTIASENVKAVKEFTANEIRLLPELPVELPVVK